MSSSLAALTHSFSNIARVLRFEKTNVRIASPFRTLRISCPVMGWSARVTGFRRLPPRKATRKGRPRGREGNRRAQHVQKCQNTPILNNNSATDSAEQNQEQIINSSCPNAVPLLGEKLRQSKETARPTTVRVADRASLSL